MLIVIVCGGERCGKEFRADTKDRLWPCPHCGRAIENKYYPFLNARLMQARIDKDAADWKAMYDGLREEADALFRDRTERIARLKRDLDGDPSAPINASATGSPLDADGGLAKAGAGDDVKAEEWRKFYDELFKSARALIIEKDGELEALKKQLDDKRKKKEKGKEDGKADGKGTGKAKGG